MPRRRDEQLLRAVGARLKEARTSKGWTQQRLAEAAGVEPITISRFETGDRSLSLSTVVMLAEKLEVDVAALLDVRRPATTPETLTDEEVLRLWRALSPGRRDLAARLLRELGA